MSAEEREALERLEKAAAAWLEARAGGKDTRTQDGRVRDAMREFRRAERRRRRRERER